METNSTNQPSSLNQSLPQKDPSLDSTLSQKGNLLIIVGVIFLTLFVGVGAYYLGTKNLLTPSSKQSEQQFNYQAPSSEAPQSVVTPGSKGTEQSWKTETLTIKKETAVSGSETINLSLQIPTDWSLQTYNLPSNSNNLIKNCANYVITSADRITTLTISPICTGWSATYKTWQTGTVIVKDEGKVGNDNHSAAIVRYPGLHDNTFIYSEGFKDQNQVQDTVMIYYGNNFIPTNISVNATNVQPNLKTTDQIVSSIKAQ